MQLNTPSLTIFVRCCSENSYRELSENFGTFFMYGFSDTIKALSYSSYSTMASLKARMEHAVKPDALRAYLAEFLSTFIFVFVAVGSTMASKKLNPNATVMDVAGLVAVAVANALGMTVAVYISATVSGGHVNPAVTFGMTVGGHLSVPMAIFYWIAQLVGSVMACLVLKVATVSQNVPVYGIPNEMTGFGASVLEGVMTFAVVYTVYAAGDPRRGPFGTIGPLAVGFIVGANILASGPFTGGSMNPAYSFGSAIVGGSFRNQAVYWVGPLVGASLAGVLYDNVMFPLRATGATDGLGV